MGINLADFKYKAEEAVKIFWRKREQARKKQKESGKSDQGERAGVTAGKIMDGFLSIVIDIVKANGLENADICQVRRILTLPGYFRPTKLWDLLVMNEGRLVAALELKSQVGPSFGKNFNNRAEEAIGSAHDFWTAYRERAFGDHPRPFVGWMILVEDAPDSRRPVNDNSHHFSVFPEFRGASYTERYDILCRKLVRENLYTTASVITTPRDALKTGKYNEQSKMTSLETFVTSLAGHVAAEAAEAARQH